MAAGFSMRTVADITGANASCGQAVFICRRGAGNDASGQRCFVFNNDIKAAITRFDARLLHNTMIIARGFIPFGKRRS